MNGVLIVAHGSRAKKTKDTLRAIADMVRNRMPEQLIEIAYMEFCDVNIEKGLTMLVEKGVTNVKVVPYFLFEGIHIQEDIPQEINKFSEAHPHINITLGNTLGVDNRLADILVDRILE